MKAIPSEAEVYNVQAATNQRIMEEEMI